MSDRASSAIVHHLNPLCPVHQQDVALIGCPCVNVLVRSCQNDNDHPSVQALIDAAVDLAEQLDSGSPGGSDV